MIKQQLLRTSKNDSNLFETLTMLDNSRHNKASFVISVGVDCIRLPLPGVPPGQSYAININSYLRVLALAGSPGPRALKFTRIAFGKQYTKKIARTILFPTKANHFVSSSIPKIPAKVGVEVI